MSETESHSNAAGPEASAVVQPPRKRRWWIGIAIALLVLVAVVVIVRNRREERAERVTSGEVTTTVVSGGSVPGAPNDATTEPATNPPGEPSAGEAARNLLVSQLSACGVDVTESTVGGESSSQANAWGITVTTPDDSALFLVNPATNEIRPGDANADRYIGMCGL